MSVAIVDSPRDDLVSRFERLHLTVLPIKPYFVHLSNACHSKNTTALVDHLIENVHTLSGQELFVAICVICTLHEDRFAVLAEIVSRLAPYFFDTTRSFDSFFADFEWAVNLATMINQQRSKEAMLKACRAISGAKILIRTLECNRTGIKAASKFLSLVAGFISEKDALHHWKESSASYLETLPDESVLTAASLCCILKASLSGTVNADHFLKEIQEKDPRHTTFVLSYRINHLCGSSALFTEKGYEWLFECTDEMADAFIGCIDLEGDRNKIAQAVFCFCKAENVSIEKRHAAFIALLNTFPNRGLDCLLLLKTLSCLSQLVTRCDNINSQLIKKKLELFKEFKFETLKAVYSWYASYPETRGAPFASIFASVNNDLTLISCRLGLDKDVFSYAIITSAVNAALAFEDKTESILVRQVAINLKQHLTIELDNLRKDMIGSHRSNALAKIALLK